jgi:PAS domain S-box-containing protein
MVLGGREEDIVGKNWFDTFIPEKARENTRGVFRKLMAGEIKSTRYYENPIIPFDGFERIIAWHNTILKDDSGKIIGTLSSGEDITDRKRMEKEIKTRMEELEAFYSIAVGRELKMKELKVEIEKLQNALSKKQ